MARVEMVNPSSDDGFTVILDFGPVSAGEKAERMQDLRKSLCEECPVFKPGAGRLSAMSGVHGCLGVQDMPWVGEVAHLRARMNMDGRRDAACLTEEQKAELPPVRSYPGGGSDGSGYRGGW